MARRSRTRCALLCLAVLVGVAGCGESPTDEIDDLFSVVVSPVSAGSDDRPQHGPG